ncbi:MAG: FxsA family protein [Gemmatimonadota bacterium]|nr:FxsA family protein [Gemmatimonadota bacterium]
MLIRLLLLFTVVPLVELWLLLRIGSLLGAAPTVGLVLATGIAGAWLARREGTHAWRAVREGIAAGRPPARELLEALLVLLAGIVLVTPGVLTDAAGLALLVRPARRGIAAWLQRRIAATLDVRIVRPGADGGGDAPGGSSGEDGPAGGRRVIDL